MFFPFLEKIPDCPALLGMGDKAHVATDKFSKRDGRIGFVEPINHDSILWINGCFLYKSGL